jgi:filamentous hemagglutinin family protein
MRSQPLLIFSVQKACQFSSRVSLSTISLLALSWWISTQPVQAQLRVLSDGSLSTQVTPTPDGLTFSISQGERIGNNLYHSFQEFSVPINGAAIFTNDPTVATIFSRVTGGQQSEINGLIRAQGNTNLFLLNPNGILFGANARLAIGGSFVGSTADAIEFDNNALFSATEPAPPLLTMSVPTGLQFGSSPSPISVQGVGHNIQGSGQQGILPLTPTVHPFGLRVANGRTLALIGGDINLQGAVLTAPSGQIVLTSVDSDAKVDLITQPQLPSWQSFGFNYGDVASFRNIQLTQRSLLDISGFGLGFGSGGTQVAGRQIQIQDGSLILAQNLGTVSGRMIDLFASDRLDVIGATPSRLRSGIVSETLVGSGQSSSVTIRAGLVNLQNGGSAFTRTYTNFNSGDLRIDANQIIASGVSPFDSSIASGIATFSFGAGSAGQVLVNTQNLTLRDGGSLSSPSFGSGAGGTLTLNADTIDIDGMSLRGSPASISVATFSSGRGGNVTVNTRRLRIANGGNITGTAFGAGRGGNVNVNAAESIEIAGGFGSVRSSINASTLRLPVEFQTLFNSASPTADSGTVFVTTPLLTLEDGAAIGVRNEGSGNGGEITIHAGNIRLRNGVIQAITASGEGGEIEINADSLVIRDRGFVNTTARGSGNGGNISINAPIIVGFNNGDIIANAVQGRGGRIEITTNALLGLQYRDSLTDGNDITASSELGVNGTVEISNFESDPGAGLVELPTGLGDSSDQVAQGCAAMDNEFIASGRGGIPANPLDMQNTFPTWSDTRDLSVFLSRSSPVEAIASVQSSPILMEANTWHVNDAGQVELVAVSPNTSSQDQGYATCASASLVTN